MVKQQYRADGLFAKIDSDFQTFLCRLCDYSAWENTVVARNFLLDEGFLLPRFESYRDIGGLEDHGSYEDWKNIHEQYLVERIFRQGNGIDHLRHIDIADEDACPETFRLYDPKSPYIGCDEKTKLIRVVPVERIAKCSGIPIWQIVSVAQRMIGAAHQDAADVNWMNAIMAEWISLSDARPVFAGLFDDFESLFGDEPSVDQSDWPDRLRDRLGLYHLDPALRRDHSIDIVVFQYLVREIPNVTGQRLLRLLVTPTVLDAQHSLAFCPVPREAQTGHTVDLSMNTPPVCRELLHPPFQFEARHVWRVGAIHATIPNDLRQAREWYLECIRESTGRKDYAIGTDG